MKRLPALIAASLLAASLAPAARAQSYSYEIWAVGTPGVLYRFDPTAPGSAGTPLTLTNLAVGEDIFDLYIDPFYGSVYAYSTFFNMYQVNTTTGYCSLLGTRTFTTADAYWRTEFDPATSQLRAVGTTLANKTLSTVDYSITGDKPAPSYAVGDAHFGVAPQLTCYAYSHAYPNAASTTAYVIDFNFDTLCTFDPETGVLNTVGPLGVDFGQFSGMTVTLNDKIYASNYVSGGDSTLYQITAISGTATSLGTIGTGVVIRDIAAVLDYSNLDMDSDGFPNAVEYSAGANMFDPFDVPFPSAPVPPVATVDPRIVGKMKIDLQFASTPHDSITVKGKLPVSVGFSPALQTVVVDVGNGVAIPFLLDAHGKATIPGFAKLKIAMTPHHGLAKFSFKLKHSAAQFALADDGLTNSTIHHAPVVVDFDIWMPDLRFHDSQAMNYKATIGGRGKARSP